MMATKKNSAFTLLEVITALAILAIAMTYVLYLREANVDTALKTHQSRMAQFLARTQLEEILLGGSKVGTGGTFKDHPAFRWRATFSPIQTVDKVQLEQISLTVSFGDKLQHSYNLVVWRYVTQKVENKSPDNGSGDGSGNG